MKTKTNSDRVDPAALRMFVRNLENEFEYAVAEILHELFQCNWMLDRVRDRKFKQLDQARFHARAAIRILQNLTGPMVRK